MYTDMPCSLTIVTSMGKAIKLHPMTHYPSYYEMFSAGRARNQFLENFNISFQEPRSHQATFKKEDHAPNQTWFSLFADEEKTVLEDESGFYGVMYRTEAKRAKRRVEKLLEKIETQIVKHPARLPVEQEDYRVRRILSERDEIKAIHQALSYFNLTDEITLTFVFSEWPDIDQMKKTDYIKEFENKLSRKLTRSDLDEIPF